LVVKFYDFFYIYDFLILYSRFVYWISN